MSLFKKQIIDSYTSDKQITPIVAKDKIPKDVLEELDLLKNTSNEIATSINKVSNSINIFSDATVKQSQEMNSTTDMLHDFNTSMEKLAYNVTNVQIKIGDTEEASNKGLDKINKLDNSLKDLQSAFITSNSTVNDLVDKLESVNTITDSINNIASQTNLLSLNAAIEAARAGEAGKGFSVVAGEVRKLAENSKKAVQSITEILNEIKNDILKASSAMNHGTDAINIQQVTLNETKESFKDIKNSIDDVTNEINDCIENLTTASGLKDCALNSVTKANSISQEHTALSQEIAASMELQATSIDDFNNTLTSLTNKLTEKYED